MSSTLFEHDDPFIEKVKQCVMAEYVPLSELAEGSSINVLIQHEDCFEWLDITSAIPAGSKREYQKPGVAKLTILAKPA